MHSNGLIGPAPPGILRRMSASKTISLKQQSRLDIPAEFARADRKPA
jgi:hypothetical protein